MLFSLANVKRRSVRDPDGELAVVPKLLHGRTALKLLEQAIEVFEGYAGKPRSQYSPRALEAVLSDYRLARCVEACLLTYYAFVQPRLEDVLSPEQLQALQDAGLAGPSDLRLALWEAVNTRHGGFVPPAEREGLMCALAEEWGLPSEPALLDTLLRLDSEAAAVLTPKKERPTARDLVRLFNRGAVQTLLAHSTGVQFNLSHVPGAALKRLYFLAKRRGVLVEIEEITGSGGYTLALYGPEQAFGTAEKYGLRLAEVTISLLRSLLQITDDPEKIAATAHLVLHDRPYRFHLDSDMLGRLEFGPEPARVVERKRIAESSAAYSVGAALTADDDAPAAEEPSFDSMVEARLYKEHRALERQGYTHGWRLQREPDPLLAPGIVLIPDFAFVRGDTRVFMEIAGFWSPTYKERKLSKLRALAAVSGEESALIIAAPQDSAPLFAGLPYPVVPYKNHLRMTDLLGVLDARYGQREQREEAAQSQLATLRENARRLGLVPETEIAQALQAYTRTELLASARLLDGEGCRYVPGAGLFSEAALEKTHTSLQAALDPAPNRKIPLEEASTAANSALPSPVDLEALLQLWPEWTVERPSLFEAYVVQRET
jgi:predicted nuclease of restriction endonuclease-like RecB superfamily